MHSENINAPRIELSPTDLQYSDHKHCFDACVKTHESSTFTAPEQTCLKNCLIKRKEAGNFLALKLHSNMQKLILSDPNMARVFGV